ncbi:MAG: hypothetical protein ACRD5H_01525 [Nitrososphaerales archaeon]
MALTDNIGIGPVTTTSFADAVGLGLEAVTYSTTQADLDDPAADLNIGAYRTYTGLDMGRVITVSIRPDLEIRALASGGATAGTALPLLTNTTASAGGTLVTDVANAPAADIDGLIWCLSGANVGHARAIASNVASTSITVTVPFPRTIAVNDTFCYVPWNTYGTGAADVDGNGNLHTTTLFDQADALIASGTGGAVVVTRLDLLGRSDSKVYFILGDHLLHVYTS